MKGKPASVSDKEMVTQHIAKLPPEVAKVIETIRQLILATDTEIGEHIKWNNPCFYYTGNMKPFEKKEYKREIIVMNLYKSRIMLVLPSGARVNDTSGLLQGDYKDGRRTIIFTDEADVFSKGKQLQQVIKTWLSLIDK